MRISESLAGKPARSTLSGPDLLVSCPGSPDHRRQVSCSLQWGQIRCMRPFCAAPVLRQQPSRDLAGKRPSPGQVRCYVSAEVRRLRRGEASEPPLPWFSTRVPRPRPTSARKSARRDECGSSLSRLICSASFSMARPGFACLQACPARAHGALPARCQACSMAPHQYRGRPPDAARR
jgi:hypothetical protein